MYPEEINKPKLPPNPSMREVALALAKWIQKDKFVLHRSARGRLEKLANAPCGAGWDFRVKQFAYSRSTPLPAFESVRNDTAPIWNAYAAIVKRYDWNKVEKESDLSQSDSDEIKRLAHATIIWGGLMPNNYDFGDAWKVVKTAVTNDDACGAPMNSGWTKVAALATHGLQNEQNIYDSRCSFSILHRLDMMGIGPENLEKAGLEKLVLVTSGRGGTRKEGAYMRKFKIWNPHKNSAATWGAHFAAAELVRRIVCALNDGKNKFPPMPLPDSREGEWDVFGVGMVLFMDGY